MPTHLSRRRLLLAASCLPALGHGAVLAAAASPVIAVPVDNAALPISGLDGNGHASGMIETALSVMKAELGWTIEFQSMPWKRAQQLVMQGTLDALCTRPTPARQERLRFAAQPMFSLDSNWAHFAPDHPRAEEIRNIRTLDQLKGFRIGLGLGNSWPNDLMREGWQTEEVVSIALLDGMARAHHIDLFFESPVVSHYWERANHMAPLAKVHLDLLPDSVVPYCFGLRRSFPECDRLIADFDRAHQRLHASGAIDRALAEFTA